MHHLSSFLAAAGVLALTFDSDHHDVGIGSDDRHTKFSGSQTAARQVIYLGHC